MTGNTKRIVEPLFCENYNLSNSIVAFNLLLLVVKFKIGQITADVAPGFIRDIGADKVEFNFKRPESIQIGGSYATKCIAKPDINVDLFVQLPKVSK